MTLFAALVAASVAGCTLGATVDTEYIHACTSDDDCARDEVCGPTGFCGPPEVFAGPDLVAGDAGRPDLAAVDMLGSDTQRSDTTRPADTTTTTMDTAPVPDLSGNGPAWVRTIGSASCGGPQNVISVSAPGVPVGALVVVTAVFRDHSLSDGNVVDSQGNVYAVDLQFPNGSAPTAIFSSRLTTALGAGDTLTVTHPAGSSTIVTADQLSGVTSLDAASTFATRTQDPALTVSTTVPNTLVWVGSSNQEEAAFDVDAGWTLVERLSDDCGSANEMLEMRRYYQVAAGSGMQTFGGTYPVEQVRWTGAIAAYR